MDIFKQAGLNNDERKCYELASNGCNHKYIKSLPAWQRRYRLMWRDNTSRLLDERRYEDTGKKGERCVGLIEFQKHLRNARKKLRRAGHTLHNHNKPTLAYINVTYTHYIPDDRGDVVINVNGVDVKCRVKRRKTHRQYFHNAALVKSR